MRKMDNIVDVHRAVLSLDAGRVSAATLPDHSNTTPTARNYSIARSQLAKASGLGTKGVSH